MPATTHAHAVRASTSVPTGRVGMWWFLASEILIFGGLITTYVLFRIRHPEWAEHAHHTINAAGAFNTFVLLTSSLTMVLAHANVARGEIAKAARNLSLTVALGGVFCVVKAYEYGHEIAAGYTPLTNQFWAYYYAMTGLHALHVVGGMAAILGTLYLVQARRSMHRVEYVGIYWHFVDIVWIFLFPLLYLTS